MNLANRITCPSCSSPLKSARGIRIGKKIACPKCRIAFTVRPEDAEQAELAAGANLARLGIVLAGILLYLLGGAGLAVYCFGHNVPRDNVAKVDSKSGDPKDDVGTPGTLADPKAPALPKPSRVSPEEQRKIDKAIADGAWYLRAHMRDDGTWGDNFTNLPGLSVGFASLPGLTLLECGIPASDPLVQKAAKLVRAEAVQMGGNVRATYQLALAILFLDRLAESQDKQLIQYLALCIIAGQHQTQGGWTYNCPQLEFKKVPELLKLLADPKHSLDDWRKAAGNFEVGTWDNSNTQFAIIALWVASRPQYQVAIDKPIALVENHFRTTQLHGQAGAAIGDADNVNLDGSWYYNGGGNSSRWPSMTCSGLLGLAIGHGVTKDPKEKNQKPLDDPAIKAGLAMLGREIDRPEEKRARDHYFLWSVQRVGVLYELDLIDGKDWYAWGCKELLPSQKNDGSWIDGAYYGNNPVLNTCFALLFLKRANLVKDLTDKLQFLARLVTGVAPQVQPPAKKE